MLRLLLLLLLLAGHRPQPAATAPSTAAGAGPSCKAEQGLWREDTAHVGTHCTMPTVSAAGLSVAALAERCAAAGTPVLIRGLLERSEWAVPMRRLVDRSALLTAFGDESIRLSISQFLTPGPESASQPLEVAKLDFMRRTWVADGSAFRDDLLRQVQAGEPSPRVQLGAWMTALRDGTAPQDAFVFHNVSDSAITIATAPLYVTTTPVSILTAARSIT
jgi:hypothetical protein